MAWSGPVLPSLAGISFPQKRSLQWSWEDQTALSGKRARYSLFSYPRYSWEVPLNFLRTAAAELEFQDLLAFVSSLQGGVGMFGYTDPNDNAVTNQQFGVGDGSTTAFQLVRTIGGNDASFVEPVYLLNGNPQIFINGTAASYTISATGLITFGMAPSNGAALTWTGSYYWPCRFDGDATEFELFVGTIYSNKALKFSSEKLDISSAGGTPVSLAWSLNFHLARNSLLLWMR